MCLADTEISQKKREECLSNALDVLAQSIRLANKYSGRDLYVSLPSHINKRANWNAVVQTSRFQHRYGIFMCQYICHHYVLCDPERNHSGIGVLLHK
jgi:hypothetical protein